MELFFNMLIPLRVLYRWDLILYPQLLNKLKIMKGMSPDSLNDAVTETVRNLRSLVFFCFYLNAIYDAIAENKKLYPAKSRVLGGTYCSHC